MKFKVGQKVRVKTDLKKNNFYGGVFFNEKMETARGNVFTIGIIPHENTCTLSDFDYPKYYWSAEMFEPVVEEFKIGDVVYDDLSGEKCTIEELTYLIKSKKGDFSFRRKQDITKTKPLKKITKEQLKEMGYELE